MTRHPMNRFGQQIVARLLEKSAARVLRASADAIFGEPVGKAAAAAAVGGASFSASSLGSTVPVAASGGSKR